MAKGVVTIVVSVKPVATVLQLLTWLQGHLQRFLNLYIKGVVTMIVSVRPIATVLSRPAVRNVYSGIKVEFINDRFSIAANLQCTVNFTYEAELYK